MKSLLNIFQCKTNCFKGIQSIFEEECALGPWLDLIYISIYISGVLHAPSLFLQFHHTGGSSNSFLWWNLWQIMNFWQWLGLNSQPLIPSQTWDRGVQCSCYQQLSYHHHPLKIRIHSLSLNSSGLPINGGLDLTSLTNPREGKSSNNWQQIEFLRIH